MKIEIDSDDLMIMAFTAVIIVCLLVVPGCVREERNYNDAKQEKEKTHERQK